MKPGLIDAPELRRAQCPLELYRAEAARDRLRALVQTGEVRLERTGKDRYGRTVGVVYIGEQDVGAALVREGHAKPWPKLTRAERPTWCGPS
ncbi:thermonuclease family protein [Methylopila capsulata]|uniref:thermonuclease family protein n=1 Tax=Methylopila capsulata TaxID=61654 RepID=UPI003D16B343